MTETLPPLSLDHWPLENITIIQRVQHHVIFVPPYEENSPPSPVANFINVRLKKKRKKSVEDCRAIFVFPVCTLGRTMNCVVQRLGKLYTSVPNTARTKWKIVLHVRPCALCNVIPKPFDNTSRLRTPLSHQVLPKICTNFCDFYFPRFLKLFRYARRNGNFLSRLLLFVAIFAKLDKRHFHHYHPTTTIPDYPPLGATCAKRSADCAAR